MSRIASFRTLLLLRRVPLSYLARHCGLGTRREKWFGGFFLNEKKLGEVALYCELHFKCRWSMFRAERWFL